MDIEIPQNMTIDKKKQPIAAATPAINANKDANQSETLEALSDSDILTLEDIKQQIRNIERGVQQKESRFLTRVIRSLLPIRKRLNNSVLKRLAAQYASQPNFASRDAFARCFTELLGITITVQPTPPSSQLASTSPTATPTKQSTAVGGATTPSTPNPNVLPEVEVYLYLLLLLLLLDSRKYTEAITCGEKLMEIISGENRRTLDLLAAKAYFYYSRAYELADPNRLPQILETLHARLRSCTLRNDAEGQAVLVNLLLRQYLAASLYEQAEKLVSKLTFPEAASNGEWARYMFYTGQLKAVHLDYTEAHRHLVLALRKAPQSSRIAVGYKQTVHKFATVVQLLLGEIPDRATFRHPALKRALLPYLKLTQAVRAGSLREFTSVLAENESKFIYDGTYSLIVRLRHNVIKTGIRLISLSYSRILFNAVSTKLQLENTEDVEFIVSKAIRDRVIEASVNHEEGYVRSRAQAEPYSSWEAAAALQERTRYCLELAKSSVRGMRFPARKYRDMFETAEERRQREQMELESARDLSDEFDDVL